MTNFDDKQVSPLSYLKVFFRRRDFLLIPAFAGLILGICSGMLLPKQYRSATTILVEEGKTDNPLFDHLAVSTTVRQRMVGIKESILGWNSLVELVKRLDLAKNVKSKVEFENLVLGIRGNIRISLRGNNIIELNYSGEDPDTTYAVVKNITDIFVERNVEMQNQETSDAITFIDEQLRVYKGKIKSGEIAKLQEELDTLLIDATEQHPRVKILRELIAGKREELKKENLEYTENVNLALQTTNPIISEIKQALDNLETDDQKTVAQVNESETDIYKVMLLDKLDNVVARDTKVNEQIYNMLLQRLETAKITQRLQTSKEGTRYSVLDPPRVPLKPSKPNKALVAFVGLFLGLLFGAGLVVAAEFLDKSFIDVEEAKGCLGVPLLGAISKINTADSLREAKEKNRWRYSMALVAGIAIVILTAALSTFIK